MGKISRLRLDSRTRKESDTSPSPEGVTSAELAVLSGRPGHPEEKETTEKNSPPPSNNQQRQTKKRPVSAFSGGHRPFSLIRYVSG